MKNLVKILALRKKRGLEREYLEADRLISCMTFDKFAKSEWHFGFHLKYEDIKS